MRKTRKGHVLAFAVWGFCVATAEYLCLMYAFYHRLQFSGTVITICLLVCPPAFLTVAFIDVPNPPLLDVLVVGALVASLNACWFACVGWMVTALFRKADHRVLPDPAAAPRKR